MTTNPFGIDLSRYQAPMRFDEVKASSMDVSFIAMRATISYAYKDPWFAEFWRETKRIGRHRMAYAVPYFGEDPQRQMDNLFETIVNPDWNHDRVVLDLELDHGHSKAVITNKTKAMIDHCKRITGLYPIIYTRKSWTDLHLDATQLPTLDWWLAHYLYSLPYPLYTPERKTPPALPIGVTDWLIHQNTCRGKSIGATSYYMDYNRWNGTIGEMDNYFGVAPPVVPDCEKENGLLRADMAAINEITDRWV